MYTIFSFSGSCHIIESAELLKPPAPKKKHEEEPAKKAEESKPHPVPPHAAAVKPVLVNGNATPTKVQEWIKRCF